MLYLRGPSGLSSWQAGYLTQRRTAGEDCDRAWAQTARTVDAAHRVIPADPAATENRRETDMNTGTKFYSTVIAASAALMVMHSAAAAQSGSANEVMMSDEPSYCEVYRALSTAPSAECPDQPAVKTRGLSLQGTTATSATTAGSATAGTTAVSTTAAATATTAPQPPRAAAFGSIQFEFNSFELTAPAKNTLDTVAAVLKDARLASQSLRDRRTYRCRGIGSLQSVPIGKARAGRGRLHDISARHIRQSANLARHG